MKKIATLVLSILLSACGGGSGSPIDAATGASLPPVVAPAPVVTPKPVVTPPVDPAVPVAPPPVVTPAPIPKLENIALWGDSLTAGGYATDLATLLIGRDIYVGGVGGQTSTQIAARQGSVIPLISVMGDVIPAFGTVAITFRSINPITDQGGGPITGTFGGIVGTLLRGSDDSYSFARSANGANIFVAASSPFFVDTFGRDSWINVFWMGRNNYGDLVQVKADIASAVNFLKPIPKKFLVLSVLNGDYGGYEISGGAGHQAITLLNNDLATMYPVNYIDVRSYLVSQYDPANAQDVIDFRNDVVPTSMRRDSVHLNDKGNKLVAKKVAESLLAKGW